MKIRTSFFFLVSLCILALDQASKYVVKGWLTKYDVIPVTSFFNIVYVENTGSAFGLFKSLGNVFFIVVAVFAIAVITVMMIKDLSSRMGLSLILGGAAGNLMDRILHGYVIDFLDVYVGKYHWPAFNVADSALTAGIILFMFRSLQASSERTEVDNS